MNNRALLLCALAIPGLAVAADGDQWYIAPFIGGISADHNRDVQRNDLAYGAAIGRELGPIFNVELSFNAANPDTTSPLPAGHLNLDGFSLDALAVGNRDGLLSPYFGLGLGGVRTNYRFNGVSGSNSDTKLGVEAEVGVMMKLWESSQKTSKLALRPELKLRWSDPGNANRNDFLYTLGIQYSFGGSPVAAAVPVAAAPPPPPPPAAEPPPPPPPPPPLDSDHDGVPDSIDKCPNTPPGEQVDATGCPIKGSITLVGVNFATNKADLTEDSRPVLDAVANDLKKHPHVKVEIQGHTDSQGKAAYNIRLSQHRAETDRNYLMADGVAADQLVAKGYGETQPVASNANAEGRAKNRRVVMFVLANPADVNVKGQGTAQE